MPRPQHGPSPFAFPRQPCSSGWEFGPDCSQTTRNQCPVALLPAWRKRVDDMAGDSPTEVNVERPDYDLIKSWRSIVTLVVFVLASRFINEISSRFGDVTSH